MEALGSLIERTRSGDMVALECIVKRFQDMAYGYAYSILGDFHQAEDAAQEAFIEAYYQLPSLRVPDAFPGWFRRIVFKQCDRIIRRKRVQTVPLDAVGEIASMSAGPSQIVEQREMHERVIQAVRSLPERQREVITLFYIDGYSQADIAKFLEVPVTTVKKRLYDSRRKLKERMMDTVDETLKSRPLGEGFADLVVRQVSSQGDLKGAGKFLGPGYYGKRNPEYFETVDAAQDANIYVVREGRNVRSAGFYDETVLSIGSTVLRAARPREMAGEAEGVPDPIFVKGYQGCFKLAKEKGCTLSVIHGSQYDHAFCGFVPCFYYPVATLPRERAQAAVSGATIREVRDDAEEKAGDAGLLRDPYATKISAGFGGGPMVVVEENGAPTGYFRVDPAERVPAQVTVQTRQAALAVIKYAGEMAGEMGNADVCFLQSHMTRITRTLLNLGGKYLLRPSCDVVGLDAEMVAILDLVALTRGMQGEFGARLRESTARECEGCLSIEMRGTTVGFCVRAGGVEIVSRKQSVQRVLPRWILTRLYMGYYSGEDVLAMGPVPCDRSDGKAPDNTDLDMVPLSLPQSEAALFKALFPKLWPCSMPDPDVWPWVIGEEHPRYQHEESKTPEMKARIDALRFAWIGY